MTSNVKGPGPVAWYTPIPTLRVWPRGTLGYTEQPVLDAEWQKKNFCTKIFVTKQVDLKCILHASIKSLILLFLFISFPECRDQKVNNFQKNLEIPSKLFFSQKNTCLICFTFTLSKITRNTNATHACLVHKYIFLMSRL